MLASVALLAKRRKMKVLQITPAANCASERSSTRQRNNMYAKIMYLVLG